MRRLWLWGWLLCLGAAIGQEQPDAFERVIPFREPAQRVEQILKTLSQRGGVPLVAAPEVKNEIVLIDAETLTLRELMDGLAQALDAEWRKQPDGAYRLGRTVSQAQRRRAQENARLVRMWREQLSQDALRQWNATLSEQEARNTLQELRDTLAELVERDDALYQEHRLDKLLGKLNPLPRLLYRVMSQFNWTEWVQIPIGEYRVYGSRPTTYVRPFPKPIAPLIRQFRQEALTIQSIFREAQTQLQALQQQYEARHGYRVGLGQPDWRAFLEDETLTLYLTVRRFGLDTLWLQLYIVSYDSSGRIRALRTTYQILSAPVEPMPLPEALRKVRMELSPQSQLQWRAVGDDASLDVQQIWSIAPSRVEPLSLVPTEILQTYARAQQKPLIALLHDPAVDWRIALQGQAVNVTPTLGGLERYLNNWEWLEGKTLIAKPRYASYWWNRRYDRQQLAHLAEQIRKRGYSNEEEDDYLIRQVAPDYDSFRTARWWLEALGVWAFFLGDDCVHLREALGETLWQRLKAGETFMVGELSPAVQQRLNRLIYNRAILAVVVPHVESVNLWAPAVCYPNGLPPHLQLRITSQQRLGFFSQNLKGVWSNFIDRDLIPQLAQEEADESLPPWAREAMAPLFSVLHEKVPHVRCTRYTFEIRSPDPQAAYMRLELPNRYEVFGAPSRWNEPPDELRNAIEPPP